MDDTKKRIISLIKTITGSSLNEDYIVEEYNSIELKRKINLFNLVDRIIQERSLPFDEALPLIKVEISVLSTKENIDSATLLFLYIVNLKTLKV